VRSKGLTNHKIKNAKNVAASGLYDTIQFSLSSLSAETDLKLIEECKKMNLGFIAMKALSGGPITNAALTFSFLRQFDNVVQYGEYKGKLSWMNLFFLKKVHHYWMKTCGL
jgi:uncharacterized protein